MFSQDMTVKIGKSYQRGKGRGEKTTPKFTPKKMAGKWKKGLF